MFVPCQAPLEHSEGEGERESGKCKHTHTDRPGSETVNRYNGPVDTLTLTSSSECGGRPNIPPVTHCRSVGRYKKNRIENSRSNLELPRLFRLPGAAPSLCDTCLCLRARISVSN